MSDLWELYPQKYRRCPSCGGQGRRECTTCWGKGGSYKVHYEYDYDGHPIRREKWEPCYSCSGRRTTLCYRCSGTGSINRSGIAFDQDSTESISESSSPQKRRSLDDLIRAIYRQRDVVIKEIRSCWELDASLRQSWKEALLTIDLLDYSNARQELEALKNKIDQYSDAIPATEPLCPKVVGVGLAIMRLDHRCSDYHYERQDGDT
jgi:hypothetical protein